MVKGLLRGLALEIIEDEAPGVIGNGAPGFFGKCGETFGNGGLEGDGDGDGFGAGFGLGFWHGGPVLSWDSV